MKMLRNKLTIEKIEIIKVENADGQIITNKEQIMKAMRKFYKNYTRATKKQIRGTSLEY